MTADPVAIASELIRCRSITPDEGGALSYLQELLTRSGFEVHRAIFAEPGTPPVDNLYARIGSARPNLLFAGHTDVVPPGNESAWSHPPFAGEVAEKGLYGRGDSFDHCILGEPSNLEVIGDTIKVGRRGSLNGTLIVTGRQGHVAYPERSDNPIPGLVSLIAALQAPLDEGNEHFSPSHLEFTSVDVGNTTVNLIPGEARARFNIRYNDRHSQTALKTLIERRAKTAAAGHVRYSFEWQPSNADVFVTKPGAFTELASVAIAEITGLHPKLSTSGGTSDARFIKDYCPVLEFGLVGQTMHQVDERVPLADLTTLTAIYRRIIEQYFDTPLATLAD